MNRFSLLLVSILFISGVTTFSQESNQKKEEALKASLGKLSVLLSKLGTDAIGQFGYEERRKFTADDFSGCRVTYSTVATMEVGELKESTSSVYVRPEDRDFRDEMQGITNDRKSEIKREEVKTDKIIKQRTVVDLALIDPTKFDVTKFASKKRAELRFYSIGGQLVIDREISQVPKSQLSRSGKAATEVFWVKDLKLLDQLQAQLTETINLCKQK